MEQEKIKQMEVPKSPSFLRRYRVIFVTLGGLFALHLGWWQLVENYVPPEERPKRFEFLGKLNSLIHREKEAGKT